MSSKIPQINADGILVEVVRKKIKNLYLRVYPPGGRVRVTAPVHVSDESVRSVILKRLPWIKKTQENVQAQERKAQYRFVGFQIKRSAFS